MRVIVAGSSGLIGRALVASLRSGGHEAACLVRRRPTGPDEVEWHPESGDLDVAVLRGADAVVNLCGAGIGDHRWSGAYKQALRDSRLAPADVLSAVLADTGFRFRHRTIDTALAYAVGR